MKKSYNRQFRKNGLSFYVQTLHKNDVREKGERYYLSVKKGDSYTMVYDLGWRVPHFKTIHEAQFWALCNAPDFIQTF